MDPVNYLFSFTISPNIEPVCVKMCGQIISSDILTQTGPILGDIVYENKQVTGSVTIGIYYLPS